jgi:hypothetical protein
LVLGSFANKRIPFEVETISYAYGRTDNSEIEIAHKLSCNCNIQHRRLLLSSSILTPTKLEEVFNYCETILTPAWFHCAKFLQRDGFKCVISGMHGETLGGRYGPGDWGGVLNQIKYLIYYLLLRNTKSYYGHSIRECLRFIRNYFKVRPW